MKVKLEKLVYGIGSLELLAQKEVKVSTAFKIAELIMTLNPRLKSFQEVKNGLIKKHLDKNKTEDEASLNNNPDFNKEYQELLDTELDIECKKIKKEWLVTSKGDEIDLSPSVFITLNWLMDT